MWELNGGEEAEAIGFVIRKDVSAIVSVKSGKIIRIKSIKIIGSSDGSRDATSGSSHQSCKSQMLSNSINSRGERED